MRGSCTTVITALFSIAVACGGGASSTESTTDSSSDSSSASTGSTEELKRNQSPLVFFWYPCERALAQLQV